MIQPDMMMGLTIFWAHRVTQSFAAVRVWIKVRGEKRGDSSGIFCRLSGGLEGDVGAICEKQA